jgi:hypothetical protein
VTFLHLSADAGGVTAGRQRRSLELFQSPKEVLM